MASQTPFSKMLDVEVVGGDQRQRLAEMLRANALNVPQGQMVGNWYVKPSWTQNLAHLANTAVGVFGGQAIDEENRKTMQEDYQKFISGQSPQKVAAAVRAQGQPLNDNQAQVVGVPQQSPAAGQVVDGEFRPMKTGGVEGMPSYGMTPQPQPQQPPAQPQFDKYDPNQYSNPQFRNALMRSNIERAMAVPEYHSGVHEDAQGRQFVVSKTGESKFITDASGNPVYSNKNINAWTRDSSGQIVPVAPVQQYELTKSSVGAPRQMVSVNTQLPFKEQVQKNMGEALVKNYENLQNIPSAINSLNRAAELAPKSFAGSMAEQKLEAVKFLNNNLGLSITPDKVQNTEELRAALFTNVMENLKKLDASPSQQQQQVLQQSMGSIGTDPKAIPRIVNTYKDILTSKAKEHNRRVEESMQGPNGMVYPYSIKVNLPEAKVVRTGTLNGRKVEQMSDGSTRYVQ